MRFKSLFIIISFMSILHFVLFFFLNLRCRSFWVISSMKISRKITFWSNSDGSFQLWFQNRIMEFLPWLSRIQHLSLLMSLGERHSATNYSLAKDNLFYNLADLRFSTLFNNQVVRNIENLLNSHRYDVSSKKYDKNVLKMVTVGSLHI